MKRTHNQLWRILTLIDALAHLRMPFTKQDAIHLLEERSGSRVKVHDKTIQRDLDLLVAMDFASIYRKGIRGTRSTGHVPALYKMELQPNSNILRAAKKVTSGKPVKVVKA